MKKETCLKVRDTIILLLIALPFLILFIVKEIPLYNFSQVTTTILLCYYVFKKMKEK
ncbi:hypothetical protein [Caloranaerobacter azorensis]|uniref:hypothetical protein n=1 Tax=Caloranaerobacter azorensis TaxID=116090 RepID=UPI001356543D|nr:hypothetical protein [Caloranaerobacter azorensis]